jgi:hypothetical protein
VRRLFLKILSRYAAAKKLLSDLDDAELDGGNMEGESAEKREWMQLSQ